MAQALVLDRSGPLALVDQNDAGALAIVTPSDDSAVAIAAAAQATTSATTAGAAAAAAQAGVTRFFATIAAGVSGSTVGQFFASAETGTTRIYLRTGTSPFYVDQGDAAAPATTASIAPLSKRPAYSHAQHFWRTIRAGQDDVYVFVNSDSTWNETTEPLYRWAAEYLGPAALTHTIVYRLWIDGSGWQSPVTIQTGTGARTIYIDNAAVPGSGLVYGQGANEVAQNSDGRSYDLVLINHGHNLGSTTTAAQNYPLILSAVAMMMNRHSKADFLITLQNPWLQNLAFSRATQGVWRQVATELGLGIIDCASKWEALGNLDNPAVGGVGGTIDLAYYEQDGNGGLHPSKPAGVNISLPALAEALTENPATGSTAMIRPFSRPATNLMPNPAYTAWTGSAPDGHNLTNVTAAKSVAYVERGLYGLALTPNASANPLKAVDLSSLLPMARGRTLTYLARVWIPSSMSTTAGRVQLLTTGASNRSFTSQLSSVGRGGWRWVMACHPVLMTDTSITANLLCGDAAGADNGLTFYVDREIVLIGTMPGELDESWMTGAFVPNLYNFLQTGIPSGFTGTLALGGAANNNITVSAGTANLTRAYGNIATVPGRTYRISWGTISVTGAAGCTVSARGPNGAGTVITTSGTAANNGSLTFTATGSSHSFSINGGSNVTAFTFNSVSVVEVFSGISPVIRANMLMGRNTNGTVMDATGAAGNFKIASTVGTSLSIQGEAAQGNTKTNTAIFEVALPSSYIPGRDITVTVSAQRNGTGTAGTNTVGVSAYLLADAGTQGSNLIATAAQTMSGSAVDYTFTITGTGLVAGNRLLLSVATVVQETGATSSLTAQVNSVRVS